MKASCSRSFEPIFRHHFLHHPVWPLKLSILDKVQGPDGSLVGIPHIFGKVGRHDAVRRNNLRENTDFDACGSLVGGNRSLYSLPVSKCNVGCSSRAPPTPHRDMIGGCQNLLGPCALLFIGCSQNLRVSGVYPVQGRKGTSRYPGRLVCSQTGPCQLPWMQHNNWSLFCVKPWRRCGYVKLRSAPAVGISLVVAKILLHHVPTATAREPLLYSPVLESPYATFLPFTTR
jgi:hypothetical protein